MKILAAVALRLLSAATTLLIIVLGMFLILQAAPGDSVDSLVASMGGSVEPELVAELRRFYGVDLGTSAQLVRYMGNLLRFDLGQSAIYGGSVAEIILARLPVTLLLMLGALTFAVVAGTALGVLSSLRMNGPVDTIISTLGLIFYAAPSFWFGLMGIIVFSVRLGWLPAGGFEDIVAGHKGIDRVLDIALHMVLPVVTLGMVYMATYMRMMRGSMIEVMTHDFVRTARAKGASKARVLFHHALRNAALPLVTLVGLQIGTALGGAVVIESVFSLPGLGRLAYESVMQRDINMLMGIVLASALLVILASTLVDLLYIVIDPRTLRRDG